MLLPFSAQEHTDLVADLHYSALIWSTNSQLGKDHIRRIYRGVASLPSTFGFVWMQEERLVGYVLGSMDYEAARKKIKEAYGLKEVVELIFRSFKKPLYFINAFETVFLIPSYLKRCGTRAEWISWNTDKSHPKHGIASIQCYYALRKHFAAHGQTYFIAQGEMRSEESKAFLFLDKNIIKKAFFQNIVYLIKCGK